MLVDKFRPQVLKDIIGRAEIVQEITKKITEPDGIPHMLFYGPPGGGKTTLANCIANELFGKAKSELFYEFNASKDRGIDFVRNEISDVAKRRPIGFPYKVIFMDESDYITPDAQACFRRLIEQYSGITRFIFAANYPYKLIQPILSRFVKYELGKIPVKDVASHLKRIGVKEGMQKEDAFYIDCAKKSHGDLRAAINLLDGNVSSASDGDEIWKDITCAKLKSMDIPSRLKLVFNTNDPDLSFEKIWEMLKKEGMFEWIPALADCRAKMNFGSEKHIFLCDFMTRIK